MVIFGIFEGAALAEHRLDRTLSERLRAWLGIKPRKRWRYIGVAAFLGFFAWFIPHILWYAF